jgi:hypothetical protein
MFLKASKMRGGVRSRWNDREAKIECLCIKMVLIFDCEGFRCQTADDLAGVFPVIPFIMTAAGGNAAPLQTSLIFELSLCFTLDSSFGR